MKTSVSTPIVLLLVASSSCAARGVAPDDLLQLVDLGPAVVSPDGGAIAFETRRVDLERNTTVIRWHVLELSRSHELSEPRDVGGGGTPVNERFRGHFTGFVLPQAAQWSPDSQWIAYRRQDDHIQIWRSRRDGTRQEQLTQADTDVGTFVWSDDGMRLLFATSSARAAYERDLREEGERGYLYDARFSPKISRVPLFDPPPQAAREEWALDLASRRVRAATTEERAELAPHLRDLPWSAGPPDPLLHDPRPDRALGVNPPLSVAGCGAPECTGYFTGIWRGADAHLYFLRWTNGRDYDELGLYRWRLGTRRVGTLLKTRDLLEDCSLLRGRRQLLCSHESATTPRKFVIVDLHTSELRTVYDPNTAFQELSFGAVTPLTWRDADGIEGFGHFVAPVDPSIRRPPLIIVQYRSRGFLRGGIGDEFPIHVFATHGFAVLSFHRPDDWDLQRSVRSYAELERLEYVGQRERRRILSVLIAGMDVLDERGAIDPQRIGITGLSDGGETVAFGLIHAPKRFAAAAAGWTAYTPSGWYLAGPKTQPLFESYGLGFPRGDSQAQWREFSLALNADCVRAPLLLQVSDQELLPELEAVAALEHHGKPVELYVFPEEYHVMVQPRHRRAIYRRSLQWFDFWLQGRESGDPLDPEQYVRWRELRARLEH